MARRACGAAPRALGALATAGARSRPSTPKDPSRVNVQTLCRRTNAGDPVSHACDGQVGRDLAARTFGARCSKTTSLQAASAKSFPTLSSAVFTPASTASGVVCAFTLRTERVSPRPLQASISHQTLRHKSAQADVLASVAFHPRWFTPCSTKLLSVSRCERNAQKNE